MTTEQLLVGKIKNNGSNHVTDAMDEIPVKDNSGSNMNDLEKLLSTLKLKPVNNCTAGFSKLASQIYLKSSRESFQFNLMVLGCSGLGKSSFLDTLFRTQFPKNIKTSGVTENIYNLVENDVKLRLKIIEIPKFGDKINNIKCWKKFDDYLDKCFENQFKEESKISRSVSKSDSDHLVHACFYFIQPRSDKVCLKELDLDLLKNIHNKVNVIPIIAKADTMTARELELNKSNLLAELRLHEINFFKFTVPSDSGWRMESNPVKLCDKKFIQSLIKRFPFAVIAGSETVTQDKEQIIVRQYPWGRIEVDNLSYSDTAAVRTLVLSTHLQELIQQTHNVVYEQYRSQAIRQLSDSLEMESDNPCHPLVYFEKYFKILHKSFGKRIEEMESGFQELVKKKEFALSRGAKELEELSNVYENERNQELFEYNKRFNQFIAEKTQWDCDNIDIHETYGTLKISRNGRLKIKSKLQK